MLPCVREWDFGLGLAVLERRGGRAMTVRHRLPGLPLPTLTRCVVCALLLLAKVERVPCKIEVGSTSSLALRERSFAAFERGDTRLAADLLAAARHEDPNHFSASDLYNLASLFHDLDGPRAALLYKEALASGFRQEMHVYHNLGDLATRAGTLELASKHFERALAIEANPATQSALARVKLLYAARRYDWSRGLNTGDASAWATAFHRPDQNHNLHPDSEEVSIWCAMAENTTLLVSNEAILHQRRMQELSSPCVSPPASASRRVCFGNHREGRYIGTSVFSKKYATIRRRRDLMLNRELSSAEDTTIPIAAFHPESGTVNLDRQRCH